MESKIQEILTFKLDDRRFAIGLQTVDRVIRAVSITKLTDSPDFIEGVIDYYGEVIAVINLRKRLGYPLQELKISDRLVIAVLPTRKIALIVDDVENLIVPNEVDFTNSKNLIAGMKQINVLRDDSGIIFIYDLDNLLNKTEEIQLEQFIRNHFSTIDK